jgi:hypothetical protein
MTPTNITSLLSIWSVSIWDYVIRMWLVALYQIILILWWTSLTKQVGSDCNSAELYLRGSILNLDCGFSYLLTYFHWVSQSLHANSGRALLEFLNPYFVTYIEFKFYLRLVVHMQTILFEASKSMNLHLNFILICRTHIK